MKNILAIIIILISYMAFGQPPQALNYQGVARDSMGHPLLNQSVGIRLSILDSSATGSAVYAESHNVTTNNNGLFNLSIGTGTIISGTFANIPWSSGNKWLKIEMDAAGGSNYLLIGMTQFLSVPYALHAGTANSISPNTSSTGTFTMISNAFASSLDYWQSVNFCFNLVEGGYSDWRLPKIEEIQSYVELNGIPSTGLSTWTSSLCPSAPTYSQAYSGFYYYINLTQNGDGSTSVLFSTYNLYIGYGARCVR